MISRERGTERELFFGCEHIYPFLATTTSFVDGYLRCVCHSISWGKEVFGARLSDGHFMSVKSIPEGTRLI